MLFRTFRTQRELDAAYDVERSVPDFMAYARQYVAASDAARRDLRHVADVRYGETLAEYADIYPAASGGAPVLVFVHGGYWHLFSKDEWSHLAAGPLARATEGPLAQPGPRAARRFWSLSTAATGASCRRRNLPLSRAASRHPA